MLPSGNDGDESATRKGHDHPRGDRQLCHWRLAIQQRKGVEKTMIELTTTNIALMAGVFVLIAVTFIICIRRELK